MFRSCTLFAGKDRKGSRIPFWNTMRVVEIDSLSNSIYSVHLSFILCDSTSEPVIDEVIARCVLDDFTVGSAWDDVILSGVSKDDIIIAALS